MSELLQQTINGLAVGTIYALVALGYTMVYGVLKLINFAHGDVMMVGSYVGYATAKGIGIENQWKPWAVVLVFVAAMAAQPAIAATKTRTTAHGFDWFSMPMPLAVA